MVKAPLPTRPLWSTHDATVRTLSLRLKTVLGHLPKESEMHFLVERLEDYGWRRHVREHITKVVEPSQGDNGQTYVC